MCFFAFTQSRKKKRLLFWFRVEKLKRTTQPPFCFITRYAVYGDVLCTVALLALHQSSLVLSLVVEVLCTFRGKIYPNYRDQSSITPCLLEVLLNKAYNVITMTWFRSWFCWENLTFGFLFSYIHHTMFWHFCGERKYRVDISTQRTKVNQRGNWRFWQGVS